MTADEGAMADCGQTCHVAVKSKDCIFHPTRSADSRLEEILLRHARSAVRA